MSAASPSAIARATCYHHPQREAAARCVSCGRPFCRECVTALDRRMFCAACLREHTAVKDRPKRDWFIISATLQILGGLLALWLTAYFTGRVLVEIPSSFHEGSVWKKVMP